MQRTVPCKSVGVLFYRAKIIYNYYKFALKGTCVRVPYIIFNGTYTPPLSNGPQASQSVLGTIITEAGFYWVHIFSSHQYQMKYLPVVVVAIKSPTNCWWGRHLILRAVLQITWCGYNISRQSLRSSLKLMIIIRSVCVCDCVATIGMGACVEVFLANKSYVYVAR